MKHVHIAGSVCLLLVGLSVWCVSVEVCRYLRTLNATTEALPRVAQTEIATTRDTLRSEIQATRTESLTALGRIAERTDGRLAAIQGDAVKAVETASARLDSRLREVTATAAGIRADAAPVFTEIAATAKDGRDTMDALYPDLQALVDTTDVAARSVSETMGAVERAAPRIANGTAQNAENIAGITHDIHVATERLTRPQTFWQRIGSALKTTALIGAHFL